MVKQYLISAALICTLLFIGSAHALPPELVETVVVNGIGTDLEKAKYNAARNALEQVIGTFISTESIIKNDKLIKDEVLAHSAGFLKEMTVLGTDRTQDGLMQVKIKAVVVSSKLKTRIDALRITDRSVNGENLFTEAFSKIDLQKRNLKLLDQFMQRYPSMAYSHTLFAPTIINTNADANTADLQVRVDTQWESSFINEFRQMIASAVSVNKDNTIRVCFERGRSFGKEPECYKLDKSLVRQTRLSRMFSKANVLVILKDRTGKQVKSYKMERAQFPNLRHDGYYNPNYADYLNLYMNDSRTETFSITLPISEMQKVTSIEASLQPIGQRE